MAARKATTPKRVRAPRGRPLFTFSLSPEASDMLEAIATGWGSSRSAAIERLIREEHRREQRK
jgi:hypothetical protein